MKRHTQRRMLQDPRLAFVARNCSPDVWLTDMDVEGIDVAILTPTRMLGLITVDGLDPEQALDEDLARYVVDFGLENNSLFSTDYPQHDSPWPEGVNTFLELPGLTAATKRTILWDNGAALYGLPIAEATTV